MSKGSKRRPTTQEASEVTRRWEALFPSTKVKEPKK